MSDYRTRYERGKVALYKMHRALHKEEHIRDFEDEGSLLDYIEAEEAKEKAEGKAKAVRCANHLIKDGEK